MPHIDVNDISLYYEIHGNGDPIVMISGFSNDHTVWNTITYNLKDKYQIILLDNRGVGQTDAPSGYYTIEQMAGDVAQLCKKIGIKKAHFVGNSMGGFIQQSLALLYPNLVQSMIISNSALNADCVFNLYLDAQLQLLNEHASLEALIRTSSCWAFSNHFLHQYNVMNQLIQMGLENPYPFTKEGYEGQYAAIDTFNSTPWAHKINAPVLVIGADQDLIFNKHATKMLAEHIKGSEYFCFSECGHLSFLEYPDKFSELVTSFVTRHSIKK